MSGLMIDKLSQCGYNVITFLEVNNEHTSSLKSCKNR
jgi:hypothetical protein